MGELRWVLLGLGVVLIAGIYLAGRGALGRLRWPWRRERAPERVEPEPDIGAPDEMEDLDEPAESAEPPATGGKAAASTPGVADRVITVRFVPKGGALSAEAVVLALRAANLRHGRYGIFHCFAGPPADEPLFSVANLTEPGSFDLNNLSASRIPGMSFFMVLPGPGDPVDRFDRMVETARALAHELGADLHDDKGSSWSIQRERYVREEIIQYRHQRLRH